MKILLIHADYINYKVKEKAKFAEEISRESKARSMRDPLIAFISVEKSDEKSDEKCGELVENAVAEIHDVASKVKTQNITLFPFAHLSDDLAAPQKAIEILTCIECKLKDRDYRVMRVPFGWYKAFEFKSKGHPLAVLSRSVPRAAKTNPAALPN